MNNSDAVAAGCNMDSSNTLRKQTLHNLLHSHGTDLSLHFRDPSPHGSSHHFREPSSPGSSQASLSPTSTTMSTSPLSKSPWSAHIAMEAENIYSYMGLMGSLVREEGHVYSLATSKGILYTGSESKNIRVWKNHKEFSSFKSSSGLVKAIVISGHRIFSGHRDGKIRVWKASKKDPTQYKRIGSMPTFKARMKTSLSIKSTKWVQHTDTISCLSLSNDGLLLYSSSWDHTFKVWRVADLKCLESIRAHDDVVNAIVTGFGGLVFTGSADGSVKVWHKDSKSGKHFLAQTLLKQDCAVTALMVDPTATFLYCGSSNGMVNFWERRKVLCHSGILKGHRHNLAVLCLAAARNLVFSGSADTNICVWRREEEGRHVCLSVLIGHTGPVKCLAVEEAEAKEGDRRYTVYSGGIDKSVKIWRVLTQVEAGEGNVEISKKLK